MKYKKGDVVVRMGPEPMYYVITCVDTKNYQCILSRNLKEIYSGSRFITNHSALEGITELLTDELKVCLL